MERRPLSLLRVTKPSGLQGASRVPSSLRGKGLEDVDAHLDLREAGKGLVTLAGGDDDRLTRLAGTVIRSQIDFDGELGSGDRVLEVLHDVSPFRFVEWEVSIPVFTMPYAQLPMNGKSGLGSLTLTHIHTHPEVWLRRKRSPNQHS